MSKLIATLVASLFAAAAFAQTGAVPPTVPAAGINTKSESKSGEVMQKKGMDSNDSKMEMAQDKKEARKLRHNKRVQKRVEKVGDKPVN